ncbi:transcription antitermination factor NusB [Mucisphaera calidilacus]|uniref:Ribosomal RNA small subunit methyltransferase B n=1 Tax=Mucisphaera calidilacus TaxID=2527982 RepID=A0A518BXS1_9BACT|nr:transcription antitermination factor NusB [Mucisphaera calidilacus]QDU71779.1 Ribosomal RNA small subunit methyltransferase B [Mucisphaera calidilacus]
MSRVPESASPSSVLRDRDRSRLLAIDALAEAAEAFPALDPGHGLEGSGEGDATAYGLYHGVMRRWLTLESLVGHAYRKPVRRLEPLMHGLLLAGAYELVFQDGTPGPAVVTAYVDIAKERVRPGAGGLANAVLRKLAGWASEVVEGAGLSSRVVPLTGGRGKRFAVDVLPDPEADWVGCASAGFSLSRELVKRWRGRFGDEALGLMAQTLVVPPVIAAFPGGVPEDEVWERHEIAGFGVWRGAMGDLAGALRDHAGARVQDPGAAAAVASTAGMAVRRVLDLCAGRGTKSVQARVVHPEAQVWAYEPHAGRRASLGRVAAGDERLRVVTDEGLDGEVFDLVLADVPCSNSAVLARRLEARYRFRTQSLDDVRGVQKQILRRAVELAAPGGAVLYSTCSLEPEENEQQLQRLVRKRAGLAVEAQELELPGGSGCGYRDGGFRALIRVG